MSRYWVIFGEPGLPPAKVRHAIELTEVVYGDLAFMLKRYQALRATPAYFSRDEDGVVHFWPRPDDACVIVKDVETRYDAEP